jgi:hypothetical protein
MCRCSSHERKTGDAGQQNLFHANPLSWFES